MAANASEGPVGTTSSCHSEDDLRYIWDSVKKSLLTIGKAGPTPNHARSLTELAASHVLVKVKLTQGTAVDVHTAAAQLEESSGCTLLQTKGSTLLFSTESPDSDTLVGAAKTIREAETNKPTKQPKQADLTDTPSMDSSVRARLMALVDRGTFKMDEVDAKAERALSLLPPEAALSLLNSITRLDIKKIRNKSAWLTSQCTKYTKGQAPESSPGAATGPAGQKPRGNGQGRQSFRGGKERTGRGGGRGSRQSSEAAVGLGEQSGQGSRPSHEATVGLAEAQLGGQLASGV